MIHWYVKRSFNRNLGTFQLESAALSLIEFNLNSFLAPAPCKRTHLSEVLPTRSRTEHVSINDYRCSVMHENIEKGYLMLARGGHASCDNVYVILKM
jgi:hypothetical protein